MKLIYKIHETTKTHKESIIAIGLAMAAAVLIKVPALFGLQLDQDAGFYIRNASLVVLPLLTVYFAWKRRLDIRTFLWLVMAFVAAGVFANIYPFAPQWPGSSTQEPVYTETLTALHLPIALWLIVGMAYAAGRWGQVGMRMNFIRFSGELFIYYVLIALGGGVLTGFMALIFGSIAVDIEPFFELWLLPCGAVGAVIVASWLVETKQSIAENMAPMLARLFTPLFAFVLITFLVTLLWTDNGVEIERNVLIAFDLLLVVTLGLLLYSVSARDPQSPPAAFDVVQVVLLVSCTIGRCGSAVGHLRAHHWIWLHPEPCSCTGTERDPSGQSCLVRRSLHSLSARTRIILDSRTLADGLLTGLCRVGGDCRNRFSTVVRVHLRDHRCSYNYPYEITNVSNLL